eukprot:5345-Eustigmatos_ZCMA.PRE.1
MLHVVSCAPLSICSLAGGATYGCTVSARLRSALKVRYVGFMHALILQQSDGGSECLIKACGTFRRLRGNPRAVMRNFRIAFQ